MVNKLVTTAGKYAAKKIGSKALEKAFDTYGNFKRKAVNETVGIKTLNVGERETVKCLQNPHNSIQKCKSVGDSARKAYHKTGQY